MIAAVAALGGLLFGFDTGVIAGAMLFIVPDFHLGPAEQGLVVSAVTFGALFGALAAGTSADTIGRRWTNIVAGISFIAGSALSALAPNVDILIASRAHHRTGNWTDLSSCADVYRGAWRQRGIAADWCRFFNWRSPSASWSHISSIELWRPGMRGAGCLDSRSFRARCWCSE